MNAAYKNASPREPADYTAICRNAAPEGFVSTGQTQGSLLVGFRAAVSRRAAEQMSPRGYTLVHLGARMRTALFRPEAGSGLPTWQELIALARTASVSSISQTCSFAADPDKRPVREDAKLSSALAALVKSVGDSGTEQLPLPRLCTGTDAREGIIAGVHVHQRKNLPRRIGNLVRSPEFETSRFALYQPEIRNVAASLTAKDLQALGKLSAVESIDWQCVAPTKGCSVFDNPDFVVNSCSSGAALCGPVAGMNDPLYVQGSQWHLEEIGAPPFWSQAGTTALKEPIAILDNTKAFSHPELIDNRWVNPALTDPDCNNALYGCDVLCDHNDYGTASGFRPGCADASAHHGTQVAAMAAARGGNTLGGAGVATAAQLIAIRTDGSDTFVFDSESTYLGLSFAVKHSRIINVSQYLPLATANAAAIQTLIDANDQALFIVAVDSELGALGAQISDNVILVGDVARTAASLVGSRIGSLPLDCPVAYRKLDFGFAAPADITAPVGQVCLPAGETIYTTTAGSSFAAPQVAVAAALYWGKQPSASAADVKKALLESAASYTGFGPATATSMSPASGAHDRLLNLRALLE